jgi:hypothetical protein
VWGHIMGQYMSTDMDMLMLMLMPTIRCQPRGVPRSK